MERHATDAANDPRHARRVLEVSRCAIGRNYLGVVLPGAAAATILWWTANQLLEVCVGTTHYGVLYGGLAAAIALMVWMELSAMIVFVSAVWNAESAPPAIEPPEGRPLSPEALPDIMFRSEQF